MTTFKRIEQLAEVLPEPEIANITIDDFVRRVCAWADAVDWDSRKGAEIVR